MRSLIGDERVIVSLIRSLEKSLQAVGWCLPGLVSIGPIGAACLSAGLADKFARCPRRLEANELIFDAGRERRRRADVRGYWAGRELEHSDDTRNRFERRA